MPKAISVKWTREHFLIALNLYCKLPFGKLHKGKPEQLSEPVPEFLAYHREKIFKD